MRAIMLAHDASLHLSRQRSAAVRHQLAWTTHLRAETYSQCALKHHAATVDRDHKQSKGTSEDPIAKNDALEQPELISTWHLRRETITDRGDGNLCRPSAQSPHGLEDADNQRCAAHRLLSCGRELLLRSSPTRWIQ